MGKVHPKHHTVLQSSWAMEREDKTPLNGRLAEILDLGVT